VPEAAAHCHPVFDSETYIVSACRSQLVRSGARFQWGL